MSRGRGVKGNREVSPLFLLGVCGGGRYAEHAEVTSKEGGSWGKHGFPHGSEPKASDGHAIILSTGRSRIEEPPAASRRGSGRRGAAAGARAGTGTMPGSVSGRMLGARDPGTIAQISSSALSGALSIR